MKKTSINIQPVKGGSEDHNLRTKPLDYVRNDLTDKNESLSSATISERLGQIKKLYKESTGQRMQKKATPIREGVVVISESTTMEHLENFTNRVRERFGVNAFQIHIHRDEGHYRGGEWKANHHAHIVFDWTDDKGKSFKLNRDDMAEMQTILAESLKMQRGERSDKKHIKAMQFKAMKEAEHLKELEADKEKVTAEVKHKYLILENKPIEAEITAEFQKKLLSRSEVAKVDKNDLKTIIERNNQLESREEQHQKEKKQLKEEHYEEKLNLYRELTKVNKDFEDYKNVQERRNENVSSKINKEVVKIVNTILKNLNIPKKINSNYQLKNLTAREMKNRL